MPRTLLDDPYVTLSFDEELRLVRYVRSSRPYASLGRGARATRQNRRSVARGLRQRALNALLPHFAAYAFLIKSAVGRLQGHRIARERGGIHPFIFTAEADALRHLGISA